MMRLIANRALKRYGTRRLSPGDEFEAKDRDGRLLLAAKRARLAPPSAEYIGALVHDVASGIKTPNEARECLDLKPLAGGDDVHVVKSVDWETMAVDDGVILDKLRRTAAGLGIEVDGRWGAKRLQSEIDLAVAAGRRGA